MKINKTYLKNGVEIDFPMISALGETETSKAIRYSEGMFQFYNFKTGEVIYQSETLKDVVNYTNTKYNLNDSVA
tara:strand:- start:242 stop:463 length:222 start_codon:yes stop_codon:yes gene_type:complete